MLPVRSHERVQLRLADVVSPTLFYMVSLLFGNMAIPLDGTLNYFQPTDRTTRQDCPDYQADKHKTLITKNTRGDSSISVDC